MGQPEILQSRPQRSVLQEEPDFSLVLGGPLYQLYLGARLARPALKLVVRRVLVISLICWLPLLLLSAIAGRLTGGASVPFLLDPQVHIRFLVSLPLLVGSEVFVHERMRDIVGQFSARGIIASQDRARFEKLIASSMRLRNSVTIELVLLIVVLALGYWLWRWNITLPVSTWYAGGAGLQLTAAGYYYAFVSLCIFRFILLRWYFRLFLWYRFLWQVRAMPLHFNLFHPDRAAGLGFLSGSLQAFAPVFVAQTSLLASVIFTRILYAGERLPAFKMQIAVALVFYVLVMLLPLGFFAVQLERAGRTARLEFGTLASHYTDDFHQKWIEGGVRAGEPLLGTPDIQSLADLANSYQVVNELRLLPATTRALVRLVVLVALPLLPLVLTMVPLEQIIKRLVKLAF
jgi:hypothetical protein